MQSVSAGMRSNEVSNCRRCDERAGGRDQLGLGRVFLGCRDEGLAQPVRARCLGLEIRRGGIAVLAGPRLEVAIGLLHHHPVVQRDADGRRSLSGDGEPGAGKQDERRPGDPHFTVKNTSGDQTRGLNGA